jgi:hypothetical protein
VILLLLLLALLPLTGQAAAQPGTSRMTLVTVADARNQPIVDLGPDDVVIREGAATREILNVHTADYPVIVLIDTGAAARDDLPQMLKAVSRFVDRLGRRPVAIGTLANPPALVTGFEDNLERVLERLDLLKADLTSDSVLLQAAVMAARKLTQTGAPFSAIVVVSATDADRSTGSPEELIGPIIDSGAILHVVANRPPPSAAAGQPAPMERAERAESGNGRLLRDVTQQTLGQFTPIYSAASYQAALDRLADRMSNELMIEYLVPAGSKPNDVRVGVRIPGARVRGLGVRPR